MSTKKDIQIVINPHFVAASLWISSFGGANSPQAISRGVYAAKVGVPRLLELLKRYNLPSTWAVTGHSIESFPKAAHMLADAGVEIIPNGYLHEIPGFMSRQQEADVLDRSIEIVTKLSGKKPEGFVSLNWDHSPNTVDLLLERGIKYENGMMEDDFHPYYLRAGDTWNGPDYEKQTAKEWMNPWKPGKLVDLVEIPANWHLDDSPLVDFALMIPNSYGKATREHIVSLWKDQFEYAYRHYDYAVIPIFLHPGAAGKPHLLFALEELINHFLSHDGVRFVTMGEAAADYRKRYPFSEAKVDL